MDGGALGVAAPAPSAQGSKVRVGITGALSDPGDPAAWSGTPHELSRALTRLGVYAGYRDATPWSPALHLARVWLRRTGRDDATWLLKPEVRGLWRISDGIKRLTTPRDVDAWVTIGGVHAVSGRFATLCDLSPSQFSRILPDQGSSFWWPEAAPAELDAHARRTVAVHGAAYACCVASHWAGRSLVDDHGIDPRRVHVVGLGQSLEVPGWETRSWAEPRFLFVGRDWTRKNGDAVVRAFVRVRRHEPRATLDVVGDHPSLSEEGVIGHGPLDRNSTTGKACLVDLYRRSTCFVMPSLIEPYGIAYVEAGAAGMGSIATSVGGTGESVGSGGIFVDPTDSQGLQDAMRLLCDPNRARELGGRAREHAELLTWDAVAQRILRGLGLAVHGQALADFL